MLNGDINTVINDLEIPKECEKRLRQAYSLFGSEKPGEIIELSNGVSEERKTLGLVPIDEGNMLIWLKKEILEPDEKQDDYGIDSYYLRIARLAIDDVLERNQRVVRVVGWIDDVANNTVRFNYYDENREFVQATAPQQLFKKISDLSEGRQFIIQTWEEGNKIKVDFLPLSVSSKEKTREGTRGAGELIKHGLWDIEVERAYRPKRLSDLSSVADAKRYLGEFMKKKNMFWRRRKS